VGAEEVAPWARPYTDLHFCNASAHTGLELKSFNSPKKIQCGPL
jgi:hypothetical protein